MQITKKQALDLYECLNSLGDLSGVRFSYAVAKNISNLQAEIESLKKAYIPSKEYSEYDNKRVELAKSHSVKKDGVPEIIIREGAQVYNIKDQNKFDLKLIELQGEYKQVISDREKQMKEFSAILEEKIDVDLQMIKTSDIPENINTKQMTGILILIKEDESKTIN